MTGTREPWLVSLGSLLNSKAMESAVHADPTIVDEFHCGTLLAKLKAIFGKAYKEGDAKSQYLGRTQQVGESYQEYMLVLQCLYNLAWPGEPLSSKDSKLVDKFVHSILDHKMAEYLWDRDCPTPDAVVQAAERKRCGRAGLELAHAMTNPGKVADEAGLYTAQQKGKPTQAKTQQQPQSSSNKDAEKKDKQNAESAVKGMKDQLTLMTEKVNQLEKATNAASKKQYYKDLQLSKNQQANNQNGKNQAAKH